MTAALRLVEELTRQGVELSTDGRKVRCRGPKKAITPRVLEQVKEHKPEIMRAIQDADSLNHDLACGCLDCSIRPVRYARPVLRLVHGGAS